MKTYTYNGQLVNEDLVNDKALSLGLTTDQYLASPNVNIQVEETPGDDEEEKKKKEESKKQQRIDKKLEEVNKKIDAQTSYDNVLTKKSASLDIDNTDKFLKDIKDPNRFSLKEKVREKKVQKRLDQVTSEMNEEEEVPLEKYITKKVTGEDGKPTNTYYKASEWEAYFDPQSEKFDPKFFEQAVKVTGKENPTLKDYLDKLSTMKGGGDIQWSITDPSNIETLDEVEIVATATHGQKKENILNEVSFDTYMDSIDWAEALAIQEEVSAETLRQILPPLVNGDLYEVEESKTKLDNDALKISISDEHWDYLLDQNLLDPEYSQLLFEWKEKGEKPSVTITVGKDGEIFGGEEREGKYHHGFWQEGRDVNHPEYKKFKDFLKLFSVVTNEQVLKNRQLEEAKLTPSNIPTIEELAALSSKEATQRWRRRTLELRAFNEKLLNTSVDDGGTNLSKIQLAAMAELKAVPLVFDGEYYETDTGPSIKKYTHSAATVERDIQGEGYVEIDKNGNIKEKIFNGEKSLFGYHVVNEEKAYRPLGAKKTAYIYEKRIKENFSGANAVLQETISSLKAYYTQEGIDVDYESEEFMNLAREAAAKQFYLQDEEFFRSYNTEEFIEGKKWGSSDDNIRQGAMIGAVALKDAEDELLLEYVTLEKNLAQTQFDNKVEAFQNKERNKVVAAFLYGEDREKALENLDIDLGQDLAYNNLLYLGTEDSIVQLNDLGFTTYPVYIKKVVNGEVKLQYVEAGTELDTLYEDGTKVQAIPVSAINDFNSNAMELESYGKVLSNKYKAYSDMLADMPDFQKQMEVWMKNYHDGQEFFVKLGIAGLRTAKNIVYAAGTLANYVNPMYWTVYGITGVDPLLPMQQANAAMTEWLDSELNEYNFDVASFGDIMKNGANAEQSFWTGAKWMMGMTAETLPIMAAMILSGGSASYGQIISSGVAGLSSAGGKFSEMDLTNFDIQEQLDDLEKRKDLSPEEKERLRIGLEKETIGKAEYILKGTAYGVFEGGLAYLTTSAQISDAYSIFRGDKAVLSKLHTTTGSFLKEKAPEWLKGANLEAMGEVGVTLGTNLVDGRNPLDGIVESYVGGFALGGIFEGVPIAHSYMTANFATNSDINTINNSQKEIIKLSKQKDALLNQLNSLNSIPSTDTRFDNVDVFKAKLDLNEEIKNINNSISEQADIMKTKQIEVQNKLQFDGIGKDAAEMAAENVKHMSDLRNQASELVLNNPSLDPKTTKKLEVINKKYKEAQNIHNKLKSKRNFGHKWMAMKGKSLFSSSMRTEVKNIEAQAIENITAKKGPLVDGPTAREIETEAMKIVDARDYDLNLDKAKQVAKKRGQDYYSFDNNNQAKKDISDIITSRLNKLEQEGYDINEVINIDGEQLSYTEYIEQQLTETLDGIGDGSLNGFFDPVTNTSYAFRENSINNQKPGVPLHEASHGVTIDLIRKNPLKFGAAGESIVSFLQEKYSDLFLRMQVQGTNNLRSETKNADGTRGWDYDEVISSFVEEVAAGNIDPKLHKQFTAYLGKMLNDGTVDASNNGMSLDFKGVNDIAEFLVGLGKDLKQGRINEEAFNKLKKKQPEGKVIPMGDQSVDRIAASKTKKSSSTTKADLVAENKKLLKDKPKGFMDKIKANAAKIKALVSGSGSAPTSSMRSGAEPASREAQNAKKKINEAFGDVKNEWPDGTNRQANPVVDDQRNPFIKIVNKELDGMIEAAARSFKTKDGGVVNLLNNVDLAELQQAVKIALLPDIRGFNKTNTSLYGYLMGRLGNRIGDVLKSGDVFNDFSTKDLDGLVGKEKGKLVTTESRVENELKFREGLNIEEGSDLYNDIKDKVETVLGGQSLPNFEYTRKKKGQKDQIITLAEVLKIKEDPKSTAAQKNQADIDYARILKDVRQKLQEAYDTVLFTQLKNEMGTGKKYEQYLKDIQPALLASNGLPINNLVAMERLSKEKIFAKVEKENISPSDIAQYEGSGRLVYTSKTSGPTLYTRLNPTPEQFVDFFMKRGRKDALVKNMGGKLGLDATMDVLSNPDAIEKMTLGNPKLKQINSDQLIQTFAQVSQQGIGMKFSRRFLDSNADQSVKDLFMNKRESFFDKLKSIGVTVENVNVAWNEVYGKEKLQDAEGKNWATEIKKEYRKLVGNLVSQKETYPGIELEIDSYVSSLEMAMEEGDITAAKKILGLPSESAAALFQDGSETGGRKTYEKAINTVAAMMVEADGTTESKLNVGINYIKYKGLLSSGSNKYIGAKDKGNGVLYGNKENYIENFLKPTFGITDYQTTSIKKEPYIIVTIDGETITVPYNMPTQKVTQGMIDGSITDEEVIKREEAADEAWDFINEMYAMMSDVVKDPKQELFDNRMLLMLNASMSANMTSPLAMAAPLRFIPVDAKYSDLKKPGGGKAYEYEHGLPRRVVNLFLLDYHFNKGKGYIKSEADLQKLKDSYSVGVIDVDMDNNYGKFFKSRAFFGYQLGDLPTTRWYNMFSKGGELHAVKDLKTGDIYGEAEAKLWKDIQEAGKKTGQQNLTSGVIGSKKSKSNNNYENVNTSITLDTSLDVARDINAPIKKIRVFDFDDTLARTNSNVLYTAPDGTTGKLNAEEFASDGAKLLGEGYTFDFSEFNKVVDGKRGPLFDVAEKIRNARGNEDLFVLTARAPEAATAIYEFLKSEGLEFKLENIIGLGNSTGEAKAEWLVGKAAEGFNDFYFADDHMANVDAVKLAMSQLDVKSKVQQAKVKFSKTVDATMNDIIYDKTGIESYKEYSSMRAQARGRTKNNWSLISPSAQDFGGLLYKLLAKGEKGNAQWEWMQENLIKPFSRGMNDLSVAQNQLMADFRTLKNSLEGIPTNLKKQAFGGFTYEDITRIAAWDRQGIKVDGLSDRDLNQIREFVEGNGEINTFVDQIIALTKEDGYHYPGGDWLAGTITTDFMGGLRTTTRPRVLAQWNQNIDLAFNEKTLNKLEAAFGSKYREALEDSIRRMKTGVNRKEGTSKLEQRFQDYMNNSVGAVMFLNARSAVLQTISAVNFINWTDNNPLKAGKAFANQKQYWTDFMSLMNSDFLVDRRNGLKINVSESEIAEAAKTTGNSVKGVISYLLNKGFVLTQFADSFAIASGGATFYRNRVNTYIKQGMSKADAEAKAFLEFRDTAEESQQSARPDKISSQQASTLGRFILAFANTPSQYARIMDKAGRDLVAGRGDWKSNISKIMYYGFVQNLMFTALQSATALKFFGDDEEELDKQYFLDQGLSEKKATEAFNQYKESKGDDKELIKTTNSMLDNILRGIGVQGVILSTIKNTIMDLMERNEKEGQWPGPEYDENTWKLLEVSPPLSIKAKKYKGGMRDYEMNSWRPESKEVFNINNPSYRAAAKVIAATTNIPVDRLFQKIENIQGAMDETNDAWQRVAMFMGWPKWQLEDDKQRLDRYNKEKEGRKEYREEVKKRSTRQYFPKALPTKEEYAAIEIQKQSDELFKLKKAEQVDSLRTLGLTTDAIKRLKYEKDRVNKIMELSKK